MKGMREIAWACGVNLGLLTAYTILLVAEKEKIYLVEVGLAELVFIQMTLCLLTALLMSAFRKPPWAKAFVLAAAAVVVMGFPACGYLSQS